MYKVTDSYGTNVNCWTWSTAMSWLTVCGPNAAIHNRLTGTLLAHRLWRRTD